ncbi:transcriptional regulator [Candidatus Bathyarchaeota archaeon]|nr:transcriptional regulator [Candidatus Bathyarchaeota archaeon]
MFQNITEKNHFSKPEKIVHIIPLGFEVDRAVKPFEGKDGFRAHRVLLLSAISASEEQDPIVLQHIKYVNIVRERLESLGIEVHVHHLDLIDLLEVIRKVSSLIHLERMEGNIVYVNMSAAGRLTSIGSTLSGMVQGVKVYYVKADGYSNNLEDMEVHGYSICNNVNVEYLENFNVELPDPRSMMLLVELYRRNMSASEMLVFLHDYRVAGFADYDEYLSREDKIKFYMRLNRGLLNKLEGLGYIRRKKLGREVEVEITDPGRYVACISGMINS